MRVLVIDDEEQLIFLYKRVLIKNNHEVLTALDGEEGVNIYLEEMKTDNKVDVVLMDYRMNKMDGIEATEKIISEDKDAKIIFVSADIAVILQALKTGAKSFLVKPFDLEKIIIEINKVVIEN